MGPTPQQPLQDSDTTRCIKNCLSCHRVCMETLHYIHGQKATHFQGRLLSMLEVCVDVCDLSAQMMIADLPFHHQSCELCYEVCQACAEELEKFELDADILRCADACRKCAESCKGMAGMTVKMRPSQVFESRASM